MSTFTSSKEISNTLSRTNRLVALATENQTMLNKKVHTLSDDASTIKSIEIRYNMILNCLHTNIRNVNSNINVNCLLAIT